MTQRTITPGYTQDSTSTFPLSPFRLFEDFFNDWAYRTAQDARGETWRPPVDIIEKDGNLVLRVEIPGVNEKEVNLKVEGDVLTITGERRNEEAEGSIYHMAERHQGSFSRSFTLPDTVDPGQIQAGYRNGILTITISQKPEVKPRTIKITT